MTFLIILILVIVLMIFHVFVSKKRDVTELIVFRHNFF